MYFDDIRLDNEFVFERKIGTLTEHEVHMHDSLEISVLQENDAKYRLLNRDYHGKPGDIFLYRPFEPHWTLVQEMDKPIKWIMVLFSPSIVRLLPEGFKLISPFYTTDLLSPLISRGTAYAQSIQFAATQAVLEQEKKQPGWQAKQFMWFIDILVNIYRHYEEEQNKIETRNVSYPGIIRSIEYILTHLFEEIDVDYLIKLSDLKKTWFYKSFKQITSVSPNEFINRLRLQSAIHLIDNTEKSITDIAFECGFNSLSYFNKKFKHYKELSPREYRNQKR